MKRRNLFLSLLLAGACAIVGVGYATITRELTIGGKLTGSKNDSNLKVYFTGDVDSKVVAKNTGTVISITPSKTSDLAANLDVSGMVDIGDTAIGYFLVENASQPTENLNAILSKPNVLVNNDAQSAKDHDTANPDLFIGDHFKITAKYVKLADKTEKTEGTGTIDSTANTVTLNAPTAPDAKGQTVWVEVTVELIDVIIADTFPTHNITVSFTASTTNNN